MQPLTHDRSVALHRIDGEARRISDKELFISHFDVLYVAGAENLAQLPVLLLRPIEFVEIDVALRRDAQHRARSLAEQTGAEHRAGAIFLDL